MSTTREQILEILATQRMATADQLSRALQVSQADVRHHLGLLVKEQLVEKAGSRTTGERGRPRTTYRLTPKAQPDNIAGLTRALLRAIRGPQQIKLLQQATNQLVGSLPTMPALSPKLYTAMQRLNELNYQAHWEARTDAPIIQLGNCPYAELIQDHPELCQMDKLLLQELSGLTAEQTAKLEASAQGALRCVFQLLPKRAKYSARD